jgi:16S rRNA (uracil1498-N3)-methyltransferase
MTAPLFYVDALGEHDHLVLAGAEGHHAADVRRLRPGEPVMVGDGRGGVAVGVVSEVSRGRVVVDVQDRRHESRPGLQFVVAQALAKGGRDEDAVEAMTEVGVDEVIGWAAARSVARWADRTTTRWTATAAAAAKQARRAWVPVITGPASTSALADRAREAALALVLHESADERLAGVTLPAAGEVLLVVGPEGGITDDELDVLSAAGARIARLGPHVLRTSTAGVAAVSLLSAASRWR